MRRLFVLIAMTLSALASELGAGAGHRCVWNGMPREMREKEDRP